MWLAFREPHIQCTVIRQVVFTLTCLCDVTRVWGPCDSQCCPCWRVRCSAVQAEQDALTPLLRRGLFYADTFSHSVFCWNEHSMSVHRNKLDSATLILLALPTGSNLPAAPFVLSTSLSTQACIHEPQPPSPPGTDIVEAVQTKASCQRFLGIITKHSCNINLHLLHKLVIQRLVTNAAG